MTLEIHANCRVVRVGQPVHLRFIAAGTQHPPSISSFRIEGGTTTSVPGCAVQDPNEQSRPGVTVQDMDHVYKKPQTDLIVVNAATYCSRFSGFDKAELMIEVRP